MLPRQTQQMRYGPAGSRGGGSGLPTADDGTLSRMPHGHPSRSRRRLVLGSRSRYPSLGCSSLIACVQALAGWFPVSVQIAAVR
jgi:hypothetical protein